MAVAVRDLACFGRPVRLVWIKRRWRCVDVDCSAKTWTEASEHVGAQVVLTRRGGAEVCRQVGELARPVATVAAELGVCWWTVMNAVVEHGTPPVDDPERIGALRQLGVDETSFLAANRKHCPTYATGLVDLERGALTITRAISQGVDGPVEHPRPKTRGWSAALPSTRPRSPSSSPTVAGTRRPLPRAAPRCRAMLLSSPTNPTARCRGSRAT